MAWAPWQQTKTLISQVNARRIWPFLIFIVTGALAVVAWLGWPSLVATPYIRVPGSSFVVHTSCIPDSLQLRTSTPYATLARARLVLRDPKITQYLAQIELEKKAERLDGGPQFSVEISPTAASQLRDAKSVHKRESVTGVAFDFAKIPAIDLVSITISYGSECKSEQLSGNDLLDRLNEQRARVMRFYLIQDKLSDLIFRGNEFVGNVLLAALTLMVLWLTATLVGGLRGVFLVSDQEITEAFQAKPQTKESIVASWSGTYKRLVFGRVLGPALGFLLTVSSLVAGLHPSAAAVRDTFQFVSSLQLALVATFMGLLVRIVAEFALRYQREFAERKMALLLKKP
jgi:hypothetical protein